LTLELSDQFLASVRYLDRTLPTIEANLALDEALLIEAEEREAGPALRVWEAPEPAVVLGASSRLLEDVDADLCRADGVAIARRSSGGGTVMIGPGALNVTVVLPADAPPGLDAVDSAQTLVLGRIARFIRALGPPVGVQGSGDLALGDRKFTGSAQRRLRRFFLVHASILYDFPIEQITRYTRLPRRQPAYRAQRPHEAFLTNLPLPRTELLSAVRSAWLPTAAGHRLWDVPDDLVNELVTAKFGDPAWVSRL
jgi:lipoate-protein ligase A